MKNLFFITLIFMSFSKIAYAETSALDKVLQSKTLHVCTAGDYKPYSFKKADGTYEGIDISMVESLAQSLDSKIEFVPISWKNLVDDFVASKCDIAVGGITSTLERQRKVYVSDATDMKGLSQIGRCEDKEKYEMLFYDEEPVKDPDKIRVNVHANDTNEATVRKSAPQGVKIEVFDDVHVIFQNIVEKKADVMITDMTQAEYELRNYPSLCSTEFFASEQSYMLPKGDDTWKLYVDQWLRITKKTGAYYKIQQQWLQ